MDVSVSQIQPIQKREDRGVGMQGGGGGEGRAMCMPTSFLFPLVFPLSASSVYLCSMCAPAASRFPPHVKKHRGVGARAFVWAFYVGV